MSKNTYLTLILTEVGYGKQTEHTSGGLSDTFQTTGRQGDFRPNHRRVMRNYPIIKLFHKTFILVALGLTYIAVNNQLELEFHTFTTV